MERREREERRLRLALDAAQQEINELKISRLQIQAEVSDKRLLINLLFLFKEKSFSLAEQSDDVHAAEQK